MTTEPLITVTPLPDGAAVRFAKDAARNARFRARFPRARWGAGTGSWHIPGKTAAQRAALWASEEEAAEIAERRRQRWLVDELAWDRVERERAARYIPDAAAAARVLAAVHQQYPALESKRVAQTIAAGLAPGDGAMLARRRWHAYLGPGRMRVEQLPDGFMRGPSRALWIEEVEPTPQMLEALLAARIIDDLHPRHAMGGPGGPASAYR